VRCTPEEIQRPLIFIGHSFGGLIAAQTLVKAKQADEDENPTSFGLYKAIYAMMFFATPHKGLMIDDI
jgi:pimeloyl-ACP methyl ester carboxylesterase